MMKGGNIMKLHWALKGKKVTLGTQVSLTEAIRTRFGRHDLEKATVIAFSSNSVTIRCSSGHKSFTLREHQGGCGWGMEDFEVVQL